LYFKKFRQDFDYEVFGFVIMDNHYHFILKINNDHLSDIMHSINLMYAKYINKTQSRSGHVFESNITVR
jgi:putative transposase